MSKQMRIFMLVVGLLMLATLSSVEAGDYMTYQGRLTDAAGVPVADGNHVLTLSIYDVATGGLPLWTDQFSAQTSAGLFSVVLGSQAVLDLASLGDGDLYLEITVGTSFPAQPLQPRTLLTSSPRAAVAGKLSGNIQTSEGSMLIKSDVGDSSIVLGSFPAMSAIKLLDPRPESQEPVLEISASLADEGRALGGPSIRMFDPQPEPPGKMFEVMAAVGQGPSMRFFSHGSEVMGVEPSPFHDGFDWFMSDPHSISAGRMFEISTMYDVTQMQSTSMHIYSASLGATSQELVNLTAAGAAAELRMGAGAGGARTSSCISIRSDESASTIEVVGPDGLAPASPVSIISDAAGARIGIGTSTPSQALHVEGNICYTGTIGACSDVAFKKDIEPIDGALEAVEHLTGVRYSWKTEQFPDRHFSSDRQVGLIAQQVKEVVPEAVTLQADGYYTVDYTRLTPMLLEAIKELKKQNDELASRLEALEKEKR